MKTDILTMTDPKKSQSVINSSSSTDVPLKIPAREKITSLSFSVALTEIHKVESSPAPSRSTSRSSSGSRTVEEILIMSSHAQQIPSHSPSRSSSGSFKRAEGTVMMSSSHARCA